tara:strand:- start:11609 stop:12199 length:591 start_codon:yes stop_codon:yes gene_type:complete
MFLKKRFILASKSSSRYNLLRKAGLSFSRVAPQCNEELIKRKIIKKIVNLTTLPNKLAKEKALSISKKKPKDLVVGSDTIIILNNELINKAKNIKEGKAKLKKLSGKKHSIISGVSVCYKNKQIWSAQQRSTITIKKLNNQQIDNYFKLAGSSVLGSVGCYQAEKLGPIIIESIQGDFFNVLGFPLFPFLSFLNKI